MYAWIRHYFHTDPYKLPPKKFARLWKEAKYLIEKTKPVKDGKEL